MYTVIKTAYILFYRISPPKKIQSWIKWIRKSSNRTYAPRNWKRAWQVPRAYQALESTEIKFAAVGFLMTKQSLSFRGNVLVLLACLLKHSARPVGRENIVRAISDSAIPCVGVVGVEGYTTVGTWYLQQFEQVIPVLEYVSSILYPTCDWL